MPVPRTATLLAGLACLLVLSAPSPVAAEYTCGPTAPAKPAWVIGQAWSGRVLDIERQKPVGREKIVMIRFRIDRVYRRTEQEDWPAGIAFEPGETIRILSSSCYGAKDYGFVPGRRYLVSTNELGTTAPRYGSARTFFHGSMAAWELHRDAARFVREAYRRAPWRGFGRANTLDEALAIVAPGLPATDAEAGLLRSPTVAALGPRAGCRFARERIVN